MPKILPVIMCGGSGTRVWPESREALPKQFIPLFGAQSTFQGALDMLRDRDLFEPAIVITNHEYRFLAVEQIEGTGVEADVVLEPTRRDSGLAVAVATELALRRAPETIVAVFAADHVIDHRDRFKALCAEAADSAAAGLIVTFGIQPSGPDTGFGYIDPGAPLGATGRVRKVDRFVEKPNAADAARYIADGYLWNSGNFLFRADVMKAEIERYVPDLARAAENAADGAKRDLGLLVLDGDAFANAPKIAIDYAVMERTDHAAVIAADMGWSDIGTWRAVWERSDRDRDGNSTRGSGLVLDGRNNYIRSEAVLTAVVGLDNVIVVSTSDAVLVLNADKAAQVKELVDRFKQEKRPEALEHRRSYRPWGYYQSIDRGGRYQVKRIVVKPGQRLSLQKHFHRAEHWIVVRGTAEVTVNETITLVHENESIYLPIGCTHRMANPGKIDLELIEVQTGSYLGEDDIVRVEDMYNRR